MFLDNDANNINTNSNINSTSNTTQSNNYGIPKIKKKVKNFALFTTDLYKKEFKQIDEIVSILSNNFPKTDKDYILFVLHSTSFNIYHAFRQLKSKNTNLLFTNAEDYIIRYMENTDLFNELIIFKGKENVYKRKQYLNL